MHFLLTRPEEDSHKLAQNLTRLGHRITSAPLLRIDYFDRNEIDLTNFQAVLFTSANGVRAFIRNSQNRAIACYAVGDATAAEATKAGFQAIFTAGGDVNKLAELVMQKLKPDAGGLLHVSGKDTAGNLSGILDRAGFQATRKQLYKAAKATALPQKTQNLIKSRIITHIPFYSPRTAKAFVQLIKAANLQDHLTKITALCLSPAVYDVINCLTWQKILTTEQPDQKNLFKLISLTLEEYR